MFTITVRRALIALSFSSLACAAPAFAQQAYGYDLNGLIAVHARANGLPEELVHRVVRRESGYRPGAAHAGNYGLMQIKYATARAMGYAGSPRGLLDPNVNLTYAVRYLAGAYRAAGGNSARAVALYARGYYGVGRRMARAGRGVTWPATQMASYVPAGYAASDW